MTALKIPPEHRSSLLALAKTSEQAAEDLIAALEKATPKLRTQAFARLVGRKVSTIPAAECEGIVQTLVEMALIRATAEVSIEDFLADINDSLAEGTKKEKLTEEQQKTLDGRLTTLLAIPSLALPAKGRSLLIDHAHYLCEARLFTDVRPVFGPDVKQSPATALIVHTLKLTYHRGRDTRDFFVVLDSHDLDELSGLVERARSKERSLQALLASAGLEPLE